MMRLLLVFLIFFRLFLWRLLPQYGTTFISDMLFSLICIYVLTFYNVWKSRSVLMRPAIFLLIGVVLSIPHALFIPRAVFFSLSLIIFLLLYTFIFQYSRSRDQIIIVWWAIVIGGIISSLYGIREFFLFRFFPPPEHMSEALRTIYQTKRACSLQGWPTAFAGFLILIIPFLYYHAFFKSSKQWLYITGFVLVILGLISSITILPLLSLIMAFLLVENFKLTKYLSAFFGLMIVCNFTTKSLTSFLAARYEYLKAAATSIMQHPFIGIGLGCFFSHGMAKSAYVHNSYLQFWVETGLLGFIGILGLVWLFWKMQPSEDLLEKSLFVGILAVLIDNVTNFTLIKPNLSFIFWIALALYAKLYYLNRRYTNECDSWDRSGS